MSDKDIPKPIRDLRENIEDMLATARQVKGDAFASAVMFLLNGATTAKLAARAVACARNDSSEAELEHFAEGFTLSLGSMCSSYLSALKFDPTQIKEIMEFARNMDEKVGEAEEALQKQ